MVNKKAQMKIQQMAFMLIAVFLFFGLVALFVFSFQISKLKESANLLEEKEARSLVSELANSPEFACYSAFGSEKGNCVDLDKIMVLKPKIENYENFWGVNNIEVRKISSSGEVECDLDNYPDCDYIDLISNKKGIGISNFVTLCRKEQDESYRVYNKCELGKIIVTYKNE